MDESTSKAGKVTQALSPVKLQKVKVGTSAENETTGEERGGVWSIAREEASSSIARCTPNHPHSKKVMKHALRQQAKRRRKNTTIAAGNSAPLPRPILVPPQAEFSVEEELESRVRPSTMMEVLNSIPGFTLKPRKRSNKKLSAAAQLEQLQTKEGSIDLETPDSILVQTNLRFLLNKHTFASLPPLYQCKLVQLLPHVDRTYHSDSTFRLSASGLNNEFFARALQQWRERLAEGEFTPENQQKLKLEAEKEKSKLDPWKLKHFEPIWGESNASALHTATSTAVPTVVTSSEWPASKSSLKTTIKVRPPTARLRTVGAVTRAVSSYRGKREAEDQNPEEQPKRSKSDAAQTQTLADLSNHLSEAEKDQVDYSESCHNALQIESFISNEENVETNSINVAGVSGIIPQKISSVEKCSMEVEAASELTCIIPSEEVFNAPPMEMKSGEDLQGHDHDDYIYVDPSTDFNESESENVTAEESIDEKDNNLLCPVPAANCPNLGISTEDNSPAANDGSSEGSKNNLTNESDVEEKFHFESSVTTVSKLPSPRTDDAVHLKSEDSAQTSQELSPVKEVVSEGPEMESSAPCSDSTQACTDKPSDSVHEIAVQEQESRVLDPQEENLEFFTKENDDPPVVADGSDPPCSNADQPSSGLSSDLVESESKDLPEIQTPDCLPESPSKLCAPDSPSKLSDREGVSELPNPAESSPPLESQSVLNQEDFSEQQAVSENETGAIKVSEPEIFSEESSITEKPDCAQEEGFSEDAGTASEGVTANDAAEESSETVPVDIDAVQQQEGSSASEPTSDNSEIKNAPSSEMSSSDKNSPLSASFESNSESVLKDANSEPVESAADSKNMFSNSPPVSDANFKDCSAENAAVSPASHVSPDVSVNFKPENFETSTTCESNPEKDIPLEVCSKESAGVTWDGVDSSTDKLSDLPLESTQEGEVAVIPMQEELEVRLEESPLPAPTCEWSDFEKSESSTNPQNPPNSVPYSGHVKLELEVTLTPEVDSQVSSTVESSGAVIAPTTIVCLPSVAAPPLPPVPAAAVSSVPSMVSSPALPYLALSTSTPVTAVRAIPTKTAVKPGGPSRGSRNVTSKPPPGAVNLERSYQICQAVIQNSPNRDQLRSQLKPPPSTLLTKEGVTTGVLPSKGNRPGTQTTKPARGPSTQPVLVKHVFTSSQGIPVTMAVLPPTNTTEMTDGGQFLLVQRGTGLSGVRRSSSAPPANNKLPVGSVVRNRPASVGIQAITRERFNGADSPVQNIYNKQQSLDNCSCNLNAMVVCQKCGAFCHDDCISSSRLCLTCLIR